MGRSDHQCLLLNSKTSNKLPPVSTNVRLRTPENTQILNRNVALQNWDSVIAAGVKLGQNWDSVIVDDKVEIFNRMVISLLHTAMPEKTICMHPSDKPWITPSIKAQIKARQKAFCRGDKIKYEQLHNVTSKLIHNAKATYYHAEGGDFRQKVPAKWYKIVYTLFGTETNQNILQIPNEDYLSEVTENLVDAYY